MGRKKKIEPPQEWELAGENSHFARIFESMLMSPAFVALTPVAVRVYLIIKNEFRGMNFTGDRVMCPYSTMEKLGVSRNTIPPALRLLEALGFIEIKSGSLMRQPSVFHFVDKWKDFKDLESARKVRDEVRRQINWEKQNRKEIAAKYGD